MPRQPIGPAIRRGGRRLALALVLLAAAAPSAAGDARTPLWRSLDAATMRTIFVGTKIEGVYSDGEGFTEELKVDMTTFYRDDDDATPGEYELKGEFLCFAYPVPIDTGCFRVWQRSENCFDMYIAEGQGFPAVGYYQRLTGTGWDSRFWRTDREPTCPGNKLA